MLICTLLPWLSHIIIDIVKKPLWCKHKVYVFCWLLYLIINDNKFPYTFVWLYNQQISKKTLKEFFFVKSNRMSDCSCIFMIFFFCPISILTFSRDIGGMENHILRVLLCNSVDKESLFFLLSVRLELPFTTMCSLHSHSFRINNSRGF